MQVSNRTRLSLGILKSIIWGLVSNYMRQWDYITAQRVDYFIANSKNVQRRIKRYYGRDSEVISPPVDFHKFMVKDPEDFYLFVGQLNPYKKADLAIRAFNQSGKKLIVIGDGPQRKNLEKIAGQSIRLLGKQNDIELTDYYSRCKGFVFPGEEDFGITPLEAMSSGKPVIAFGKGGALETVVEGKTGIFFSEQTENSLNRAIEKAESNIWDVDNIRNHAKKFDKEIIRVELQNYIMKKYDEFCRGWK